MPVNFHYGMNDATKLYYKKLVVARANEVISGGDKYYTRLSEKLNSGKVGQMVKKDADSFEKTLGEFITKKQAILEKKLNVKPTKADAYERLQAFKKDPGIKDKDTKTLSNIYKYFAEKTRPEIYY